MEPTRYLVACSCGKSLPVDSGLAGAQVTCACGQAVDVPPLRDLRKLPREAPPPESSTTAKADPGRAVGGRSSLGCAFTACLAIAVISSGASLFMWLARFGVDTSETVESNLQAGAKAIDTLSIDQSFVLWSLYLRDGLAGDQTPEFIHNLQRASMLARIGWITLILAMTSMLAAVAIGWISARQKRSS
jgi:hypothetical protein